jgi:hypothetical protein
LPYGALNEWTGNWAIDPDVFTGSHGKLHFDMVLHKSSEFFLSAANLPGLDGLTEAHQQQYRIPFHAEPSLGNS